VFGLSNLQLRIRVAIAMTVVAVVSVFGWQLVVTHISTACDPGLERFKYLQSDPAMHSKPPHAFLEWEWDQPDNQYPDWGCGFTYITYTMVGLDNHTVFEETLQAFRDHGWTEDPPIAGVNFEGFERKSPYGKLETIVTEDLAWVTAVLNDLGRYQAAGAPP
jgi:hypothetical protein